MEEKKENVVTDIAAREEKLKKNQELSLLDIKERTLTIAKEQFALDQRMGQSLMQSMFFPENIRGDLGSAMMISDISKRMDVSPMEVAQNIYFVHGKPSFSSKYMVARLNTSGCIIGSLEVVMAEDKQSCYCKGIDAKTGKEKIGITITMEMAKAEGWSTKSGSKWKTMPELMLTYRAQSFFVNTYYPQVMYGMPTVEELNDVEVLKDGDYTVETVAQEVEEKTASVDLPQSKTDEPVKEEKTEEKESSVSNPDFPYSDEHGNYNDNGEYENAAEPFVDGTLNIPPADTEEI